MKSISTHTIFIHDAPVDVRTAEQITHCRLTLSLLVSETKKDGGERGLDSEMGERERDEDRGLGHLLPLLCLPRPSPYGTSLGMRLGTTSDSTVITNEDTLFVLFSLFMCLCMFSIPDCCPC